MNGYWKFITTIPIILTIFGSIIVGYADIRSRLSNIQARVYSIERQLDRWENRLGFVPSP